MLVLVGLILASFIFIVIFGAPYVPTHKTAITDIINLFGKPNGHLVELGAGDGRIAIAAAAAGWKVTAYELNPILAALIWLRAQPYRNQITVKLGNYKLDNWVGNAQAIYMFGTGRDARYLVDVLKHADKPMQVVTYGFELPGLTAAQTINGAIQYKITGIAKNS